MGLVVDKTAGMVCDEWIEVRIETDIDAGELLGVLDNGAATGAWQEAGVVRLYWPASAWNPDEAARLRAALRLFGEEGAAAPIIVREIPDRDWNAAWARTVKPIRIGSRVLVRPPWERGESTADTIELVIEPKLAFGTGHHATTQLLIEWLEWEVRGGERVLDIGTGTGILAMVALRLGARLAEGWDHDPQAIEHAMGYARDNGFGNELTLRVGSLTEGHPVLGQGWDLVLANLDRGALSELAERLAVLGRRGATGLVSGLLADQAEEMRELFARHGLYITEERTRDGWVAMRLQVAQSCEADAELGSS